MALPPRPMREPVKLCDNNILIVIIFPAARFDILNILEGTNDQRMQMRLKNQAGPSTIFNQKSSGRRTWRKSPLSPCSQYIASTIYSCKYDKCLNCKTEIPIVLEPPVLDFCRKTEIVQRELFTRRKLLNDQSDGYPSLKSVLTIMVLMIITEYVHKIIFRNYARQCMLHKHINEQIRSKGR